MRHTNHVPEALMRNHPDLQLSPARIERPQATLHAARSSDSAAVAALARAATAGDERAWQSLVHRFTPVLRATARGFRLAPADVDDVVQATWLAALRHIRSLQKPEAFGSWLLVTARRESLRTLQRGIREAVAEEPLDATAVDAESPETVAIETERAEALRAAVRRLPDRQALLLDTILSTPGSSYAQLSLRLNMPVGAIGPTLRRGLERLRRDRRLADVLRDQPTWRGAS